MRIDKLSTIRAAAGRLLIGMLVAGLSTWAVAQSEPVPPPPPPGGPGVMLSMHGPHVLYGEEIGGGRVVTGAPMTATIETTHQQTLSDGNTIYMQHESTMYRDSQGRVRREVEFELNTPTTGAQKRSMIIITDPVAGKRYVLNPQNKTAHEMALPPPPPAAGSPEAGEMAMTSKANVTTENLGAKTIAGMQATGTRVTRTIPAGQIGNAKAIEVVTERWMSTDLQIPLLTTHTDPMMGTMTTKVTNVTRSEPDASLFQVPSDYKIETGAPGAPMHM